MGRRPDVRLDAGLIYAAALSVIDSAGLDALSMRRLGAALGVDPMAIYHHVPSKDHVLHGVVRMVFTGLRPPPATAPWRLRVREWAQAYHEVVQAHPNLILRILTDPAAVATAAREANGALDQALREADLADEDACHAAAVVVDYVNGFALAWSAGIPLALDPAELQRSFDFGLDVLITGLEAVAGRHHSTRGAAEVQPTHDPITQPDA